MPAPTSDSLRPAATVVLMRDRSGGPEVFMVRRHQETAFMGGAHVFPGGGVDRTDREVADERWSDGVEAAATRLGDLDPVDAVAFHVAAARELFEEAGVLLARHAAGAFVSLAGPGVHARFKQYRAEVHAGSLSLRDLVEREHLRLALDALVPLAHWVTPPGARRFDTRFFITRVPADQSPAHDDTETTESEWITPATAIARCLREEIVLPVPTWATLRELEPFTTVDEAIRWSRERRIVGREPRLIEQNGRKFLVLPGDPLNAEPWSEPTPPETRFVLTDGIWRPVSPVRPDR